MLAVLASIPSPSTNAVHLGRFQLRAYGLAIALGVLAGYELARKRWRDYGGDPDDVGVIAIWAVPAGLVGARLWHVMTDWRRFFGATGHPLDMFKIWQGGLGIPGGIIIGVAVGLVVGKRLGINLPVGLDMAAPCLPLAQAIGRFGNWFNQELYGGPTHLPWGLRIDPAHRIPGYEQYSTFHPTFLYEMLWNLAWVGILLWLDKRKVLRPGRLFVVYLGGYGLGRLWIEAMRVDPASHLLGLRVNIWTALGFIVLSAVLLVIGGVRRRPDDDFSPYVEGRGPRSAGGSEPRAEADEGIEHTTAD